MSHPNIQSSILPLNDSGRLSSLSSIVAYDMHLDAFNTYGSVKASVGQASGVCQGNYEKFPMN